MILSNQHYMRGSSSCKGNNLNIIIILKVPKKFLGLSFIMSCLNRIFLNEKIALKLLLLSPTPITHSVLIQKFKPLNSNMLMPIALGWINIWKLKTTFTIIMNPRKSKQLSKLSSNSKKHTTNNSKKYQPFNENKLQFWT